MVNFSSTVTILALWSIRSGAWAKVIEVERSKALKEARE
jgi:hypothetical protein